jgi:hypothetical protein
MMKQLKSLGAVIDEKYPGIYYVRGLVSFDTQIVVTSRLSKKTHSSLRLLSKDAQPEDVKLFLKESEFLDQPGDKNNIRAVLQVSVVANPKVYEKIEEEKGMEDALRWLMRDALEKEYDNGIVEGREQGVLFSIGNLMKSMHLSADEAMKALGVPKEDMESYSAKLAK